MTSQLTKAKAEACLRAVEKQFEGMFEPDAGPGDRPTLYEPGFHADGWTIAWEAHWTWPVVAFVGGPSADVPGEFRSVPKPSGVHTEAVNHWCLGLYLEA